MGRTPAAATVGSWTEHTECNAHSQMREQGVGQKGAGTNSPTGGGALALWTAGQTITGQINAAAGVMRLMKQNLPLSQIIPKPETEASIVGIRAYSQTMQRHGPDCSLCCLLPPAVLLPSGPAGRKGRLRGRGRQQHTLPQRPK